MTKYLLLIILPVFLFRFASAQPTKSKIAGKVVDEHGQPLYLATVSLINLEKKILQKTVTDSTGLFSLDAGGSGQLSVLIEFLNYHSYRSGFFKASDYDPGIIQLKPATKNLKEISVRAKQDALEIKGGNLIFNVDKNITSQGMTALELLKKMPGVDVDNETSISLNGKQGALIYLDGKPTYLSAKEVIDLLRSMPSSQLKTVELITTPGARYDAEGSAGIINLRTNKNLQKGLTATLSTGLSYGISVKHQADGNITYRKEKVTVYGGYNQNLGNYNYEYGSDRLQSGTRFNSYTEDIDKRQRMNGRLGADVQLNAKNTIGFLTTANFILGGGITDTRTQVTDPVSANLRQTLLALNDYYSQKTRRYNNNVNYRFEGKSGRSFSIDADHGCFKKSNGNLQDNRYLDNQNTITAQNRYRTLNAIDIRLFGVKADYGDNLWKGKLELGGKYSQVNSGNDGRFYHILMAAADSLDEQRSNYFTFKERIAAAYLNYGKKLGKLSVDAGVRFENTNSDGVLSFINNGSGSRQAIKQDYSNFFPFLSFSFAPAKGHSWSISYNKRISRPAYQELNPFVYLLDELSFWQGNPFLKPQSTHRLSLQYGFRSATFVTFAVSRTNRFSANVTDTLGLNKIVMVTKNLGIQDNLSLNIAQNIHPVSWLDVSLNGLGYYLHNDISPADFANLNLSRWAARLNGSATLRFPWKLTGEISGAYNTRRLGGANTISRANGRLDLGLQRPLSKNALLRLAISDLYKGTRTLSTQNFSGFKYSNYGYYESRQLRLNFTYKFASGKVDGQKKRESALDKENERTGN
ncbi:TonB-dependent receptor [Hufsiella ginkgonis]|uniref:TonB-dependent receptor n=1 Tax=Hufsiella ginkgonis TaxID=2695274 RepID=A0A7K1XZK9_9SPHI|nr:TonB-dependent receptor [Hufsiella ginkgonis]MXV16410.1 TonB-dependent receptor [Hufsiella ginkgonis]